MASCQMLPVHGRSTALLATVFTTLLANLHVSEGFFPAVQDDGDIVTGFVHGGEGADITRHPYLISLRNPITGVHFCAAALISPSLALTAAHCMETDGGGHPRPSAFVPRLCMENGATDGCDPDDEAEAFTAVGVSESVKHESWTGSVSDGADFAVIFLSEPLHGHPTLKVLPQPDPGAWEDLAKLYVVGWGIINGSADLPERLQAAELPYHPEPSCRALFSAAGFGLDTIKGDMLCAGGLGAETCQGDSGGPLLLKGDSWQEDVAVGIVSFGNQHCGDPDQVPGVFTKLASYAAELRFVLSLEESGGGGDDAPPVEAAEPWCSISGSCNPAEIEDSIGFCNESEDHCTIACGGVFCSDSTESPSSQPPPAAASPPLQPSSPSPSPSSSSPSPPAVSFPPFQPSSPSPSPSSSSPSPPDFVWSFPPVKPSSPSPSPSNKPPPPPAFVWSFPPAKPSSPSPSPAVSPPAARPPVTPPATPRRMFLRKSCQGHPDSEHSEYDLNDFGDNLSKVCQELCSKDRNCEASVYNVDGHSGGRWICQLYDRCVPDDGEADDVLIFKTAKDPLLVLGGNRSPPPAQGPAPGRKTTFLRKSCEGKHSSRLSKYGLNDFGDDFFKVCQELCVEDRDCEASVYNEDGHDSETWLCELYDRCVPEDGESDDVLVFKTPQDEGIWQGNTAQSNGVFETRAGMKCDEDDEIDKFSIYDLNDDYADHEFKYGCSELCEKRSRCQAYVFNPANRFLCRHYDRCRTVDAGSSSVLGRKI